MSDPLTWIRAAHFAATLALAGAVIFGAAIAGPALCAPPGRGAGFRVQLLRVAWSGFAIAMVSGAAWLVVLAAQMSERAPTQAFSDGTVWTVLLHTTFGHDWLIRLVLAVLLAAALCRLSAKRGDRSHWAVAALLAAAFAAALVHSGHAAATTGWLGTAHRAADGLHLIAASAWVGGLLPLVLLLVSTRRGEISLAVTRDATLRFSRLGVLSVGVLLVTGVMNGWLLAGGVPALVGTDYGRLLLVKVALFLAMVVIAAVNRLRFTPRLVRAAGAATAPVKGDGVRALARNSMIEATLGLAILVVVGALGTTPPGSHVQPAWPFAVRFSDAAFSDPSLRGGLVLALWTGGVGVLLGGLLMLIGAASWRLNRWLRASLVAAGGVVSAAGVIHVAPSLSMVAVEAYPTSFHVSPTGYSAASIVHGADLFAIHCAACHGRRGRGDGPAGRFFRVKPSDLTADHVYDHTDGDLYWWIANGIGDVMPPLGAALDDDARWNVIDFVRANADAARLGQAAGKVTDVGYRAPDFSAVCPDGSAVARDDLRGRTAHLVISGRDGADRVRQLPPADGDVVTVAVPLGNFAVGTACRTDDGELAKALAMLAGKEVGDSDGTEFLVDASGSLRAIWSAGDKTDWRDAGVLQREIAAIRDAPSAVRTRGTHVHGH
jgi:putative copper export protein/mono/diheme cytochrome c family protein